MFSASLGMCLQSVGDGINFLQVNIGRQGVYTHTHTPLHLHTETHKHSGSVKWMYSSVKEHQVCVNTASCVCHMDSSPMTYTAFSALVLSWWFVGFSLEIIILKRQTEI